MNPIITPRRVALCCTVLLLSGFGAFSAIAGTNSSFAKRVPVAYGDLDLSKPADAEALYRRISSAARRACGEPDRASFARVALYQKCYEAAVTDAVSKVDQRTLTALHRAKTQRSAEG
jgi:UrcA family protein